MTRRNTFFIFSLMLSVSIVCVGQSKNYPKNLKQAIQVLDHDCPDTLKRRIRSTPDENLKQLGYPWGGKYKTVFEWTNKNSDSKLRKYLLHKGISAYQDVVVLKAFKDHLLGLRINESTLLLPYKKIEDKWNKEDARRYTTDSLRSVYIPEDLYDCFKQIDSFWNDSTKLKVKSMTEDQFTARAHLGFGMWMRNNWQLWGGSRLSKYFNELEIYHPEDMSGIILHSYHKYLNGSEIKLQEQIESYKEYWAASKRDELKRKEEEFQQYSIGDTVEYRYNQGFVTTEQEKKFDDDSCVARGIVTEKDITNFELTVILLESCDKKGIVYHDNKNMTVLDPRTKQWVKPKKRVIEYMKKGEKRKFSYDAWDGL